MNKVKLFELQFDAVNLEQMIETIVNDIKLNNKVFIQTVNVDHLILMKKDVLFKRIVHSASYVTCDGMPILWTSKLRGSGLPQRVTGADLTIELFKHSREKELKIFIFGAAPGVAETAKKQAETIYSGVNIVGTYSPHPNELVDRDRNKDICLKINQSGANILLMALGTPKQEKWYWDNKEMLNINVVIGVGAAIDFIAGIQKRAPVWVREFGFEWLYRLINEPRRLWKRYLYQDMKFIPLFIKELLSTPK